MKKTIAFIVVLTLIIIPFSTTFAGTDADDEIITIEDIIDLFPEIEEKVKDALSNEVNRSAEPEYVYSKKINECNYMFTIYTDDSFSLLIEYAPEAISEIRSTYNKLFKYMYNYTHLTTQCILYNRVYYNYTGNNTAPIILYNTVDTANAHIVDYGVNSAQTYAYSMANGYYVVLEIGGYPVYDYCVGLYVNATADEGHNFLVDSGATTIYP